MIVLAVRNIGLVWGIHTWINVLLLGPAPHFIAADGSVLVPAGSYIGIALALSFVVVASLSTAILLLGWRLGARVLPRLRRNP